MAHSWSQKFNQGLATTAQIAGTAHTAYQVGRRSTALGRLSCHTPLLCYNINQKNHGSHVASLSQGCGGGRESRWGPWHGRLGSWCYPQRPQSARRNRGTACWRAGSPRLEGLASRQGSELAQHPPSSQRFLSFFWISKWRTCDHTSHS